MESRGTSFKRSDFKIIFRAKKKVKVNNEKREEEKKGKKVRIGKKRKKSDKQKF